MTDTQKDELYLDIDFRFSKIGEETVVNPHVTMQKLKSFIICKIEEAEKRGVKELEKRILSLQATTQYSTEELQGIIDKSNLTDK